jgi:hypothetical protein
LINIKSKTDLKKKNLKNSLVKENEDIINLEDSLFEENNFAITKEDLENITVYPLMINISDSENEGDKTNSQNKQNYPVINKKNKDSIYKKLLKDKQFFDKLNLANDEIQNLNFNEDEEMNETNTNIEGNIKDPIDKIDMLKNIKNSIFSGIQNLGKGIKPNSDDNIKQLLKSMSYNDSINLTLLGNKRLMKNRDDKNSKDPNFINFCLTSEVQENEIFYKENRSIKNKLRKTKMKSIDNAETSEKIIEDNFDICEGQLELNRKFKKSLNKLRHIFHFNTEQL